MDSCQKKLLEDFSEMRTLDKMNYNEEYKKLLEKLNETSFLDKETNNSILDLYERVNTDNQKLKKSIEYEISTLQSYLDKIEESSTNLKKIDNYLDENKEAKDLSNEKLVLEEEKRKEISLKFSVLVVSIILLLIIEIGILFL